MHARHLLLVGVFAASIVAGACANVTVPPGGPEDKDPPVVLKTTPTSGSIGVKPKAVVIQFDEVIAEAPRGAQDLSSLVFISPKAGLPDVEWGRTRISIRPRKGWKPNTVYSITVTPGIADLRNNTLDSTIRVVFSTGGAIPQTHITGLVFDWVLGKIAPKALVEAVAPDSTTYQVLSDSIGRYDLGFLPPGPYVVRAFTDKNNNRDLDPLEAWDTASVTLTTTASLEFYTFTHDTVGLRISDLSLLDSNRVIKVTFDKPFVPDQQFVPAQFTVKRKDSTLVSVRKVETSAQRGIADSLAAKVRADSIRGKADTSAVARARADSITRKNRADSVFTADRADREARRLAILRGGRPIPKRDTTPLPKMKRPMVYSDVFITLAEPLEFTSSYRVQVASVKSLSGTVRSPARSLTTPKPPKRDTLPSKRDTLPPAARDTVAPPVRRDTLTQHR